MEETEAQTKKTITPRDIETARGLLALGCCHEVRPARKENEDSSESSKSPVQSADDSTKVTDKSLLKIPNPDDNEIEWSLQSQRMRIAWSLTAMSMGYYSYPRNIWETPEKTESIIQEIDQVLEQKDTELPRENVEQKSLEEHIER